MERSGLIVEIGIAIVLCFAALIGILIYKFDRPSGPREKLTGRGGDFQD